MARPRKKLDDIKLFQINLRVTLNEQVQLEEIAKMYGLNLIEYIKRRALQKQLPKFTMSGLQRDLLIELSRIGNNINQMSKRVNQGNPNLKGLESELSNLHKQLNEIKATATETVTGLKYKIIQNGTGKKPADGTNVLIHYAGYLEDGSLFDSSYEVVAKEYGKFDENRAKANGYQPFPFQYGNKSGLIPGFIEALSFMNYGDKIVAFIPSKLGYGERGAGNVIPPNANIVFEIELIEAPTK